MEDVDDEESEKKKRKDDDAKENTRRKIRIKDAQERNIGRGKGTGKEEQA